MSTTHLGSPLGDGAGTALTPQQVDATPAHIPRVTVTDQGTAWVYTDPSGLTRKVSKGFALPRLHGEHTPHGHPRPHMPTRVSGRGIVLLLPPDATP